ncbi:hypothetical protein V2J09_015367 [Rumex salicifolius]
MYSSRGGNSYQQQGYGGQSSYGQNSASAYPGSSSSGPDASSQLGMNSRHPSIISASREQDIGGYRSHPSGSGPYGGQYSSLYGAASLSSSQQVSALTAKGAQSSAVEARGGYGSLRPNSPRYASTEYVPSTSLGYTLKTDRLLAEKIPDYASIDRRQYADRQSAYMTRDLPNDGTGRYSDSVGYAHHQPEIYDRIDQAVLREQILKSQSMQTASHDSAVRQADYLAARAGNLRHPPQEVDPYVGRGDSDPRAISTTGRSSYNTQHTPSILGAAPQRNMDSLLYSQGSTNPGYGVSLPPGRDYGLGKGLHASALESDFSGSVPSRSGHLRIDDRKDERAGYTRALDLRDESRQRERLLERERERERDREKEKERERRQREREREQERERERKRALELRERELQRRRALEVRRERTPLRTTSKDRHASVLMKDATRRDSPRVGSLHSLSCSIFVYTPVSSIEQFSLTNPVFYYAEGFVHLLKEGNISASLVDVERDFLSVDKRYSKLYVSPDFSKLVVNWPREDLKLSFHTPVSFEHDFVEEGNLVEQKESLLKLVDVQNKSSGSGYRTVWNAKVILMSGLSRTASEELSSEKLSEDRVPHMCNLLRFAVLRKDRSFMAIGGPWDPIDGPDPSVDASSLIQTVIRYARDVTQLDLRSCKLWNRFLEVHYDRVGKDGLFSHKEITVLFVPDLSDCLPLLDAWREQWLAHKKGVAERERQSSLKREKEKSRERKDDLRDKEGLTKDVKRAEKSDKQKDIAGSGQVVESFKEESDRIVAKGKEAESGAEDGVKKLNKEDSVAMVGETNVKTEEVDNSSTQENIKPVKKKIVKRIIKQKIVTKKSIEGSENKNVDKVEEVAVNKNANLEISGEMDGSSAENSKIKMVTRKKVAKKLVDGIPVQTEVKKSIESAGNNPNLQDASQDKPEAKADSGGVGAVRGVPVKKKIIKKIIKRVPKKKNVNVAVAAGIEVTENDGNTDAVRNDVKKAIEVDVSGESKVISDAQPETKFERKADEIKQEDGAVNEKKSYNKKMTTDAEKQRVSPKDNVNSNEKERSKEKEKDTKDKKSADVKDDNKRKFSKEIERKKSEEPPRHPGLILQTKSCKDSKVHSLSLSLDSLLDYTDKDVEESAFELSLFAESLYEMLQYQMGSRIFAFLEKLRVKFVLKRNQRKRQREEADAKKKSKESQSKRLKSESSPQETENTKSVVKTEDGPNDEKSRDKVEKMEIDEKVVAENSNPPKQEKEDNGEEGINQEEEDPEEVDEEEEDPEEDLEEDEEEMQERSLQQSKMDKINADEERNCATADEEKNNASGKEEIKDAKPEEEKNDATAEKASGKEKDTQMKSGTSKVASKEKNVNGKDAREQAPPRKEYIVDKGLLEAFRFFDRNRAGYIRLEDMRLILHALGKYHSHRDIKELAQSALLESSTGRDDRILYEKLLFIKGCIVSNKAPFLKKINTKGPFGAILRE